ncbi:MAG TPA: hypothetical protein VHY58_06910 [Streptosporangiaceae bacterium]|nr:hypothetical protein [Streptosporangiaceae bacterium]
MTGDSARGQRGQSGPGRPPSAWAGAGPEIVITAVLVAAVAVAAYVVAGSQALAIVMIVAAVAALVVFRWLLPPPQPPVAVDAGTDSIIAGWSSFRYWQNLSDLRDGMASLAVYEARLRPALEHLLAARLAERHGVNLYRDPAEARRLLCRGGRDRDVWAWIDPGQAVGPDGLAEMRSSGAERRGIPRRTLERLINRLEQL